jgi:hypothetical protein
MKFFNGRIFSDWKNSANWPIVNLRNESSKEKLVSSYRETSFLRIVQCTIYELKHFFMFVRKNVCGKYLCLGKIFR